MPPRPSTVSAVSRRGNEGRLQIKDRTRLDWLRSNNVRIKKVCTVGEHKEHHFVVRTSIDCWTELHMAREQTGGAMHAMGIGKLWSVTHNFCPCAQIMSN